MDNPLQKYLGLHQMRNFRRNAA